MIEPVIVLKSIVAFCGIVVAWRWYVTSTRNEKYKAFLWDFQKQKGLNGIFRNISNEDMLVIHHYAPLLDNINNGEISDYEMGKIEKLMPLIEEFAMLDKIYHQVNKKGAKK